MQPERPREMSVEDDVELARTMGRLQAEREAVKVVALIVEAAGGSVFVPDRLIVGPDFDLLPEHDPIAGGRRYSTRPTKPDHAA